MSEPLKIIPPEHIFKAKLPCPYCGGELWAQAIGWSQDKDGLWMADSVDVDCQSEPEIGTVAWDEWMARHTDMPYVYWHPVTERIQKSINAHYRFDMEKRV